jgi:hypothetical protein
MRNSSSDFTAVLRDELGIHILKCKIINDKQLVFQTYNKTSQLLSPQFKINADFGVLPFVNPNKTERKLFEALKSTKNVNRNSLIGYYQRFKLMTIAQN